MITKQENALAISARGVEKRRELALRLSSQRKHDIELG